MHDFDLRGEGGRLPNASLGLPEGELRSIVLHWTAGDYQTVYPAYHFCVSLSAAGTPVVSVTHDLRANLRDVRDEPELPYAAHVTGRNSFAAGVAVAAMQAATPHDFGAYPLRDDLLATACALANALCRRYGMQVVRERVFTHAEAAVADGYFGDGEEQRWDIARLRPHARKLVPAEAEATGDFLRAWVRAS